MAENEILEHHVKMTKAQVCKFELKRYSQIVNVLYYVIVFQPVDNRRSKKIVCTMFKRGRCKFSAEKCRFSHTIGEKLMSRLLPERNDFNEKCELAEPAQTIYAGSAVR